MGYQTDGSRRFGLPFAAIIGIQDEKPPPGSDPAAGGMDKDDPRGALREQPGNVSTDWREGFPLGIGRPHRPQARRDRAVLGEAWSLHMQRKAFFKKDAQIHNEGYFTPFSDRSLVSWGMLYFGGLFSTRDG